jgi:hypothetical protein
LILIPRRPARGQTLSLAEAQGLTMYDLSYLEFALRLALPLASLDKALRTAAAACGLDRSRPEGRYMSSGLKPRPSIFPLCLTANWWCHCW